MRDIGYEDCIDVLAEAINAQPRTEVAIMRSSW